MDGNNRDFLLKDVGLDGNFHSRRVGDSLRMVCAVRMLFSVRMGRRMTTFIIYCQ